MTLIDSLQTGTALTANGAVTNASSLNNCLDFFFLAGASRRMPEADIISVFTKAFNEDAQTAMRILFWARDCRGGAGERRLFRICWEYASANYPDTWHLSEFIPEFGRWDDLFYKKDSISSDSIALIKAGLEKKDGLLAKWLPRKGKIAALIAKGLGLSPKAYRKLIVGLSKTVEQQMCAKQWSEINYSHVPSQAMQRYKKAFERNDAERFTSLIKAVVAGEKDVKINASVLYPYQVLESFHKAGNKDAIRAQWKSLADYSGAGSLIAVCDTSGSMTMNGNPRPIDVCVSLGVYISERLQGPFKDCFITFSQAPSLQKLNGDIIDRFSQLSRADRDGNTNLQAVFDLILGVAVRDNLPQDQLPEKILIISDMEFDSCAQGYGRAITNYSAIKQKYQAAGYKMPYIIFWNVNGRLNNVPAQKNEYVGLVSGFSPALLKGILSGEFKTPLELMLTIINGERYEKISIHKE